MKLVELPLVNCRVAIRCTSVHATAALSQILTCPGLTEAETGLNVAVRVTTLTVAIVVTEAPPEVRSNIVVVGVAP